MAVLDHDPVLKEKAKQKQEQVQHFIRSVERACEQNLEEDRQWLLQVIQPSNPCFATLVRLIYEPKYKGYLDLCACCLRAVQMLLRIARTMFEDSDPNLGWKTFVELAGSTQAEQALPELRVLAEQQADRVVASNAVTVLAELGPCALTSTLVPRVLELFEETPDRASDLSEVVLRVHAWGGECREQLCNAIVGVNHNGGHLLVEVLLQMINRCDFKRQQRAAKVLTGCFGLAEAKEWMYTNDSCVLVELLLREIPAKAEDPKAFHCFSNCVKALLLCSQAAATHRRSELWQVMDDLRQDDRLERSVRQDCVEVLEVMQATDPAMKA
ncbi:unnamed protein product [Durusdinium trenchii]|uniref:SPIN90/Ldb17 leucine-rich domain-containing protein n=2 Tax=Durusdinium trenchii TaxID=1381693 RepID=A0ABP0JKL3_9DINO